MSNEGEIRKLKLSFVRGIIYALEAAGIDQQRFMRSIGVQPMWLLEDAERPETPLAGC